jgi:TPR repeat protein
MKNNNWIAVAALLLLALAPSHQISMAQTFMSLEELRLKATRGSSQAQYELGERYAHGKGVAQDDAEAAKWYRKAAEQGVVEAQVSLALSYQLGLGVREDSVEAVKWYRRAAEAGDWGAQLSLSHAYEDGRGVPQDYIEAYKWRMLSNNSRRGLFSKKMTTAQIAEAERLAFDWKSARGTEEKRSKPVQQWDGTETTAELIEKAENGDTGAQYVLSGDYEDGKGVRQDYVEAYKWYLVAELSQGTRRLAKQMSPADLEKAESLARGWKADAKRPDAPSSAVAPSEANGWKILACTIEKSPLDEHEGNSFTVRFNENGKVLAFKEELAASINASEISFTTKTKIHLTISRVNGRFVKLFESRLMGNGSCVLATKPKF